MKKTAAVVSEEPIWSLDAEMALLGSMTMSDKARSRIFDRNIDDEDFWRPAHRNIFNALASLHAMRSPVDFVTLKNELLSMGCLDESGGPDYLEHIAGFMPSSEAAEHYGKIVKDRSVRRNRIKTGLRDIDRLRDIEHPVLNGEWDGTHSGRKWQTMDAVTAKTIDWLWHPYFPLGIGYVLLFGDSDIGKSTSLLAMVAGLSIGVVPGGDKDNPKRCEPVRSIILSAEDSAAYVVKPRLEAFGADMKMVMVPEEHDALGMPKPFRLDEEGVEELRGKIADFGAKFIIIDPLASYFTGSKMADRLEARAWTKRITSIAISEHCCPVIVHHVNKAVGADARHRASDSQDFFDASRSALFAVHSKSAPDDYALVHEKHNLTMKGDSIGYTFSKERGFLWTGASDLTSEAASAEPEEHIEPGKKDACKKWIVEQLESSGAMLSDEMQTGAKKEGWSLRTYRSARSEMRDQIKAYKEQGKDGKWWTQLRSAPWTGQPYRDTDDAPEIEPVPQQPKLGDGIPEVDDDKFDPFADEKI